MNSKLILASQSPRRKQLLEWAEISFHSQVEHSDESYPEGMQIEQIPVYIARNKALAVLEKIEGNNGPAILAADTIVVIDDQVIGKPENREDAINMLGKLSGRQHRVITGVHIRKGQKVVEFADITSVWFHPVTLQEIEFYVDKYQPYDKAGAYAIQEWIGVVGIQKIEGDFYNVMGLPVSRVVQALKDIVL